MGRKKKNVDDAFFADFEAMEADLDPLNNEELNTEPGGFCYLQCAQGKKFDCRPLSLSLSLSSHFLPCCSLFL